MSETGEEKEQERGVEGIAHDRSAASRPSAWSTSSMPAASTWPPRRDLLCAAACVFVRFARECVLRLIASQFVAG